MAAQSKLVFSKFLPRRDWPFRQQSRGPCHLSMEVMPSYFSFCTVQDSGQFFTLSARKGTANPFSQVDYGETLLFITT
ncbi:hypothetical protein Godav_003191 [Gossypium davidsonii]|uniref:Uncharacterized protein n=1 Tax=Gossypium davidsonii TaxID=34287 RepID=A0A7J8SZE2_GOSDV|nr:hypothetical protein [Gossypium davidsonii]